MRDMINFLQSTAVRELAVVERAVSLLWWHGRIDHTVSHTAKELCDELVAAGYARPNVTLLRRALAGDRRTAKAGDGGFRIKVNKRETLDALLLPLVSDVPPAVSNTVLDMNLLTNAREYNKRVALQISAAYDNRLYDCCAVMARRLAESLIIDAYEAAGKDGQIKGGDGNFLMLRGMVAKIESDNSLNISRNAVAALKRIKTLGDLSAHSRRHIAVASDIDEHRGDLRIAVQDLLHLSSQG